MYVLPLKLPMSLSERPLVGSDADELPIYVGRRTELLRLAGRIAISDGGSFLVCGFRGVGKTAFVAQLLRHVEARKPSGALLASLHLPVARPTSPLELMHQVVRGLHARLEDLDLLDKIPTNVRERLELASIRTMATLSRQQDRSTEATLGLDLAKTVMAFTGLALGSKRSKRDAVQMSWLGYDERAAEHDLCWIGERLKRPPSRRPRFFARKTSALKIIIVLDELDKLTDSEGGGAALVALLMSLKTLLTASGFTFVFVGGRDLYERWQSDCARGDGILESVFTAATYLGGLWDEGAEILENLIPRQLIPENLPSDLVPAFKDYLVYHGRGIPRRFLRHFNEYVNFADASPSLCIEQGQVRSFRLFSQLLSVVDACESRERDADRLRIRADERDRLRLTLLHLTDWILARGLVPFALKDVLEALERLNPAIRPLPVIEDAAVHAIVPMLVEADFLEEFSSTGMTQPLNGPANVLYRLKRRRLVEIGDLAERLGLRAAPSPPEASGTSVKTSQPLVDAPVDAPMPERFRIEQRIGSGGAGVVYKAIDRASGEPVAIKLLPIVDNSPGGWERLSREARTMQLLRGGVSPRLVHFERIGSSALLAMEYLAGSTVQESMAILKQMPLALRLGLGAMIAETLAKVHEQGIIHCDIKPGNVMLSDDGRVILFDFGLGRMISESDVGDDGATRYADEITGEFMVPGTPKYMAPERFTGRGLGAANDVFSLGVILYEFVAGRHPFGIGGDGDGLAGVILALNGPAQPLSIDDPVLGNLAAVVVECLAKDPADRPTAARVAERLSVAAPREHVRNLVMHLADARLDADVRGDITVIDNRAWVDAAAVRSIERAETAANGGRQVGGPDDHDGHNRPRICYNIDGIARVLDVGSSPLTIGRDPTCELQIADEQASRFHARVARIRGEVVLSDLNSANGTRLNGRSVLAPIPLAHGDRIAIGATEVVFLADHPAAP